jgi:hypothetical protein
MIESLNSRIAELPASGKPLSARGVPADHAARYVRHLTV